MNKEQIARHRRRREQVLAAYGGACTCCGEKQFEFLVIDHVDGGGNAHRRSLFGRNGGGHAFYVWLIRNGYPPAFRVLCHNCNMSRGLYGYCPHEKK